MHRGSQTVVHVKHVIAPETEIVIFVGRYKAVEHVGKHTRLREAL